MKFPCQQSEKQQNLSKETKTENDSLTGLTIKISLGFVFLSVFAVGIYLRLHHLNTAIVRSPDEVIYTQQAGKIAQKGLAAIREMVIKYSGDKILWLYPPPTRIGYLIPFSLMMRSTGNNDAKNGAYLSTFWSAATLVLITLFAIRFFNIWVAFYALLFMSVSPFDLTIARRAWQDSLVGFLGLLFVFITCELLKNSSKKKPGWYALFVLCGSYSILVKESGMMMYFLCSICILANLFFRERAFSRGIIILISVVLSMMLSFAVIGLLSGKIFVVFEVLKHIKEGIPFNKYALEYQCGPWHRFFQGFWIASPITALLSLIGIASILRLRRNPVEDPRVIMFVLFFAFSLILSVLIVAGLQNLRYISPVISLFYVMGGYGLWQIILFLKNRTPKTTAYILTCFIAALLLLYARIDYERFKTMFVFLGSRDLSIKQLIDVSRL